MLLTAYGRALLVRAQRVRAELQAARARIAALAGARSERNAPIFSMLTHERRARALVALAELQHMPSVAESLGISQPAVSMALRAVEENVGVALFQRTARGMVPTLAGAALVLHLKRALAEIRHAVADIEALRGHMRGTVTVGALPLSRTRLLPQAIAAVVGEHRGLRVATVEGPFEALVAGLRAGDIDFIVGALRPADFAEDLVGVPLGDDELAIVARSGHPLVRRRRVAPRDLAQARWALPRKPTPSRMLFERAFAARGLGVPDVVLETSDLAVLRGVLVDSDLVTAISARQFAYELDDGLLKRLPFALPDTRRVIGITRRADGLDWPGARRLLDELARLGQGQLEHEA